MYDSEEFELLVLRPMHKASGRCRTQLQGSPWILETLLCVGADVCTGSDPVPYSGSDSSSGSGIWCYRAPWRRLCSES